MRFLVAIAVLSVVATVIAQIPPEYGERAASLNAATTEADIKLGQEVHETYKAAMTGYFDGSGDRGVPMLLRLVVLQARHQAALSAAMERAGIPSATPEMEVIRMQDLAFTHGRLARAYFLAGNTERCSAHLAQAASFGQKALASAEQSAIADFPRAIRDVGLHSPDEVFEAVRRRDESERRGERYVPAKANCLLEDDARKESRAPQQGR